MYKITYSPDAEADLAKLKREEPARFKKAVKLLEENKSGTVIQMLIKGESEVNAAMNEFHDAQVEYKNACEAINVYKKWLDTLREQYQREWSQAGRE